MWSVDFRAAPTLHRVVARKSDLTVAHPFRPLPPLPYLSVVSDLDRLFRHIVRTLGESDPGLEYQPVPLAELLNHQVPYRSSRRAVGAESSEDYELLFLRLASGEGGLVVTEPEAARVRFAQEAKSPNPDFRVLRDLGAATLRPNAAAVEQALSSGQSEASFSPPPVRKLEIPFPPPPPIAAPTPVTPVPRPAVHTPPPAPVAGPATPQSPAAFCGSCGGKLPGGRAVMFCPYCGRSFRDSNCPKCGAEVEPGWKHCVGCGTTL